MLLRYRESTVLVSTYTGEVRFASGAGAVRTFRVRFEAGGLDYRTLEWPDVFDPSCGTTGSA